MKNFTFTLLALVISITAFGQSSAYRQQSSPSSLFSSPRETPNSNTRYQEGYYRSNGTYVQPHMKTESNGVNGDEYRTEGNTNPHTGQQGTRPKDYTEGAYRYGQGKEVQIGERGGQYYINSNGNKTYVPKRSSPSSPW